MQNRSVVEWNFMCTVLNENRCMLHEGWFQTGVCNKYKSVFIGVLCIKIPCILWNSKVLCCVQNWVPCIPVLSQINPVALPSYFFKAHFSVFSPLYLGLPSGLFSWGFIMKTLCAPIHVLCTCHVSCPSHPPWFVHPHNIGWGIQTWISLLRNVLHSSVKLLV
jgi:hypothetical protein